MLIIFKHPKPLFLRCIEEYASGKMQKDDLVCIIRETVKFMFEFLTISDRDSKDAITMFSTIMNDIYIRSNVDKDIVINVIANEMISKAVTADRIKSDLANMDAYEQNKRIAVALLSLYEATSVDENGNAKISYDKAYTLLHDYGQTFSLDHLLVQSPEADSEFKYYRDDNDKLAENDDAEWMSEKLDSFRSREDLTRPMVQVFLNNVVVYGRGRVEVELNDNDAVFQALKGE